MAIHQSSQAWVAPTAGYESVIPNPKHKLLDQIREVMRLKHYSLRTERTYCEWVRRYVRFHQMKGREEMLPAEPKMKARRWEETDPEALQPLRRGWCLGSAEFKRQRYQKLEPEMGENHSGELRLEVAEAKAERIIREDLKRLGWKERNLIVERKSDAGKLAIAGRLRRETTLTIGKIAQRLHLGSLKSASARIHEWMRAQAKESVNENLNQPGEKTNAK